MKEFKPIVVVLLGPTGSGKTELGIELAERLGLEIHNIDSRQIYKDMDIGTAKPTKAQQKRVKHLLIDLKPPNEKITVQDFQKTARLSLEKTFKTKKVGFLVGGSGLYLKAVTHGLCPPAIAPQETFRKQLKDLGQKQCHQLLEQCDPISSHRISRSDAVRTIRALEVFYATGQSISSLQSVKPPSWHLLEIGLNPNNLKERIFKRSQSMFTSGLIAETEHLINRFGPDLPLLKTIGYEEASKVIHGELSIVEAINQTSTRTNRFAKRQRTWFKGQHNPRWLNENNSLCEALSLIHNVIGLTR